MNERHQAELLSRWLAAGAKGEPPPGLDPDTVAAVWALRPELAPAPRVSVDDILAGLSSGPFAVPTPEDGDGGDDDRGDGGGEVVPFPVPPSRPAATEPAVGATGKSEPGRRWWIGGSLGLLAAAAAALLVLGPQSAPTSAPTLSKEAAQRGDQATAKAERRADIAEAMPAAPPAAAPSPEAAEGRVAGDVRGGALGTAPGPAPTGMVGGLGASTTRGAAPPPVAAPAPDAVAWSTDAEEAPNLWGGENTAATDRQRDDKMPARLEAPSSYGAGGASLADEPVVAVRAESVSAGPSAKQSAAAGYDANVASAPAFDAAAVIARAAQLAATDELAAARLLEPSIREGTAADGARIALAAARYARDAGNFDLAEALARAGLARGGSTPDAGRLTSLLSVLRQAREADAAAPAVAEPAAPPAN